MYPKSCCSKETVLLMAVHTSSGFSLQAPGLHAHAQRTLHKEAALGHLHVAAEKNMAGESMAKF